MSEEHPETPVVGDPVTEPKAEPIQDPPAESHPLSDAAWAVASSRWLSDCVRNSPISQSTEAWNHLGTVLHKLRDYIRHEMKGE